MDEKEKKYLDIIKERVKNEDGQFYHDNVDMAVPDISWLLNLVEKLKKHQNE